MLIYSSFSHLTKTTHGLFPIPELLAATTGLLLLVGLWTPLAGTAALLIECWALIIGSQEPWAAIVPGLLGLTIAMIGPGAWSIDARIFGRKHIDLTIPQK